MVMMMPRSVIALALAFSLVLLMIAALGVSGAKSGHRGVLGCYVLVVAAALLVQVVVALFIAGTAQFTLPRQLFAGLRDLLAKSIVAIATILIVVSITLLAVVELLQSRRERIQGQARP